MDDTVDLNKQEFDEKKYELNDCVEICSCLTSFIMY